MNNIRLGFNSIILVNGIQKDFLLVILSISFLNPKCKKSCAVKNELSSSQSQPDPESSADVCEKFGERQPGEEGLGDDDLPVNHHHLQYSISLLSSISLSLLSLEGDDDSLSIVNSSLVKFLSQLFSSINAPEI